jgi:hypothetical protein
MDGKLKGAMAVAIAVGLIVGAFPALVSNPGFAKAAQSNVSVNRATKGDRLPLKRISAASLPVGGRPSRRLDVTQRSAVPQTLRAHISLVAAFHEL